jgi:hypothetical protein
MIGGHPDLDGMPLLSGAPRRVGQLSPDSFRAGWINDLIEPGAEIVILDREKPGDLAKTLESNASGRRWPVRLRSTLPIWAESNAAGGTQVSW